MRAGTASAVAAGAPVGPTLIVAALPEELAALLARTRSAQVVAVGPLRAVCGRIGRAPVVVCATGDGRQAAERGLTRILDALPVGRVLAIGVSGGLTPDLGPGSLVVARRLLDGAHHAAGPDPSWLRRAEQIGGAVLGVCVTAERILGRAAEKTAAAQELDQPGPATVDLESAVYARVAAQRGLPCLVVRAVSDASWEDLPLDFEALRRPDGGVSRIRVVARALAHPRAIPGLLRMRRRVAACAGRLAAFVAALVDGGTP